MAELFKELQKMLGHDGPTVMTYLIRGLAVQYQRNAVTTDASSLANHLCQKDVSCQHARCELSVGAPYGVKCDAECCRESAKQTLSSRCAACRELMASDQRVSLKPSRPPW